MPIRSLDLSWLLNSLTRRTAVYGDVAYSSRAQTEDLLLSQAIMFRAPLSFPSTES